MLEFKKLKFEYIDSEFMGKVFAIHYDGDRKIDIAAELTDGYLPKSCEAFEKFMNNYVLLMLHAIEDKYRELEKADSQEWTEEEKQQYKYEMERLRIASE